MAEGKKGAAISEEKTTAASYILTFYQEVLYLTHNYSMYFNTLTEFKQKYGSADLTKMGEIEKDNLKNISQQVRYYIHKCYIQYICIAKAAKFKENKEIEEIYTVIKDVLIIDRDKLEKFVIAINRVLIDNVMKGLLETSQDLVEKVFK